MPRTLPWLTGTDSTPKRPRAAPKQSTPRKRAITPGSDGDLNTTGVSTPERRSKLLPRAPSTSPPPEPLEQEAMREGYLEDDIWMMVEDEFLSTAQSYTQHLHRAEYQRLKQAAIEKETAVVSGLGTSFAPLHRSLPGVKQKVRDKIRVADRGDQTDGHETLAGLMDGRRNQPHLIKRESSKDDSEIARRNSPIPSPQPSSPPVGTNPPRLDMYEYDSDDLDAPMPARQHSASTKAQSLPVNGMKRTVESSKPRTAEGIPPTSKQKHNLDLPEPSTLAARPSTRPANAREVSITMKVDGDDKMAALLAKRKAAKARGRDSKQTNATTNEIPTFLF